MNSLVRFVLLGPICDVGNWLQLFLLRAREAHGLPPLTPIVINSQEQLVNFCDSPPTEESFIIANIPPLGLIEQLLSEEIPLMIYLPGLDSALNYVMGQLGYDFPAAARLFCQTLSSASQFTAYKKKFILNAEKTFEPSELLKRITHIFPSLKSSLPHDKPLSIDLFVQPDSLLTTKEKIVLKSVCNGLLEHVLEGRSASIYWPLSFFREGDTLISPPRTHSQELVGPARVIFYGPYLHLPPGTWKTEVVIGLKRLVAPVSIRLEFYDGPNLKMRINCSAQKDGVYSANFLLEVLPTNNFHELRVLLDSGEIEGQILFGGALLVLE